MRAETKERFDNVRWDERKSWASSIQHHIAQPNGSTRIDEISGLVCCKNKETTGERGRGVARGYYGSPPCE